MADYFIFLLQWAHVLFAIYLIGGGLFFEFFAKPSIQTLPPQEAGPIIMGISKKFTILVHISWIVIILSGIYRAFIVSGLDVFTLHNDGYGMLLEMKMGVVAFAYGLSIYMTKLGMDMGKAEPEMVPSIAKRISLTSRGLAVAGVFIILFAVGLRNYYQFLI